MNSVALTVLLVSAATILLKGFGPVVLGGRHLPGPMAGVLAMAAPALLAALVATNTFGSAHRLVVDPRAAGVAAAAVSIALKAPLLATVVLAAAVTAGARLLLG